MLSGSLMWNFSFQTSEVSKEIKKISKRTIWGGENVWLCILTSSQVRVLPPIMNRKMFVVHCARNGSNVLLNRVLEASHLQAGKEEIGTKTERQVRKQKTFSQRQFLCQVYGVCDSDGPCAQWVCQHRLSGRVRCATATSSPPNSATHHCHTPVAP